MSGSIWRAFDATVIAALCVVACAGAAIGLSFPLMSLNLDDWGLSPDQIGVFTLAAAGATILATPLAPPILARFPVRVVLGVSLAIVACVFLALNLVRDVGAWFALRGTASFAYAVLFVSAEAWVLERAPPERRGLVLGIFASTFAGAMALGGVVIKFLGHSGPEPFFAGAAVALLGIVAMALPGPGLTAPEGEAGKPQALLARIRTAPILMLAPLAMGAIETAKYNLIPIYARRAGLGDDIAALMITASGVGVLLFQPLIGALADRLGPRRTLALCASAGVILPLGVALAANAAIPALILVFLFSGLVTGLYTVGLIWMARFFTGGELAAANAAFALCYGFGQLAGPAVAGVAFNAGGPWGFMACLAGFAALYLTAFGVFGRTVAERAPQHAGRP